MHGSFQYAPPEPRDDVLARPRLLRSLKGRWERRVTSLVGGPGLGKTTLLAQAIAENQMDPRGEDVWVGVGRHEADADRLAALVAEAINASEARQRAAPGGGNEPSRPAVERSSSPEVTRLEPEAIADAFWRRAPVESCLVIDDVHLLPQESTAAEWLGDLVEALPANGHVVLASRSDPPIPLSRLDAQGATLRLSEDELRFSEEELAGFAARRGVDLRRLEDTAGWPAMVELAASVDAEVTGDYLWEEVLQPLGSLGRHVLAVLCELGGADDELASVALGSPVELSRSLADVPLISRSAEGWYRPHSLWQSAPGLRLDQRERVEIRQRAANHLADRGRFDEALGLLQDAQLWEAAPRVLRSACLETDRLTSSQLGRWLSSTSDIVRSSTAGWLARGLHTVFVAPDKAAEPLEAAAAKLRAEGDVEAEMAALSQLVRLAWWRHDREALRALEERTKELETTGHPKVPALLALGAAIEADFVGDDAAVLARLNRIDSADLDPASDVLVAWLAGVVRIESGDAEGALELVQRHYETVDPAMRYVLETVQGWAWWAQGRIEEAIEIAPSVIAASQRTRHGAALYVGLTQAAIGAAHLGDLGSAKALQQEALGYVPSRGSGVRPAASPIAEAASQLAEGDEQGATETLRSTLAAAGLDEGTDRRAWRQALPLSYILLPETRAHWDAVACRGLAGTAKTLSAAVVAFREGADDAESLLRELDVSDVGIVRAALHYRFAAELAVGLAAVGRGGGRRLLHTLGRPGRRAVQELVGAGSGQAKAARALLAAVPAPPPATTYLGVLGQLTLHRGGPGDLSGLQMEEVIDPGLRRRKVQELVAYLVAHRKATRGAVAAALWPDLDERSAGNNLSVTLNHVLGLLEPWREPGDPAYLLRSEGSSLVLETGDYLRVDADEFDRQLKLAARAEADGAMSEALDSYLRAADLYRGDLHAEVIDADWFLVDREHYRTRFVSCAIRAAELLLGRGDAGQADEMAKRALAVDAWADDAYAVLVRSALARGDRSGARRLLEGCLDVLEDLGVAPSESIQLLQRRLQNSRAA